MSTNMQLAKATGNMTSDLKVQVTPDQNGGPLKVRATLKADYESNLETSERWMDMAEKAMNVDAKNAERWAVTLEKVASALAKPVTAWLEWQKSKTDLRAVEAQIELERLRNLR